MPVDLLAGGTGVRTAIENGDAEALIELALGEPSGHRELVSEVLLYERDFQV